MEESTPKTELINAKISKATLGYFDGGIFSYFLVFSDGAERQYIVGGDRLETISTDGARTPLPHCGLIIGRLLQVLDVATWEEVPGCHARLKIVDGALIAIGNIMKERWCHMKEEMLALSALADRPKPFVEVAKGEQPEVEKPTTTLKDLPNEEPDVQAEVADEGKNKPVPSKPKTPQKPKRKK